MDNAAAKKGDMLVVDGEQGNVHVFTPSSGTETNDACDFQVSIDTETSANVFIARVAAAIQNGASESDGTHPLLDPKSATGTWSPVLSKNGSITGGSDTVLINGKPAVRDGDAASCCQFTGKVVVQGNSHVFIGD